jgi:hypothetical protein
MKKTQETDTTHRIPMGFQLGMCDTVILILTKSIFVNNPDIFSSVKKAGGNPRLKII